MANRDLVRPLGLADEVAVQNIARDTIKRLKQPRTLRRALLAAGPLVVLVGALFAYLSGGRYVTTDNVRMTW
ncbi:MAG: hypothetical protein ISP49_10885 [Reyranella sp.]|jgi:membrane fusion protein (multidrug efflux system)|nr:hypothetical protein [Reyranella sp.]